MTSERGALARGLLNGGAVRLIAMDLLGPARKMVEAHQLTGSAVQLGAELAVAAGLMSAYIKGDERITVQVQGERPRFGFMGEFDAEGGFRGRVQPSHFNSADGRVDGVMLTIKHVARREIYRGATALQGGVADALQTHLSESSQVSARLAIRVELDASGVLTAVQGALVERLPSHEVHETMELDTFEAGYGSIDASWVEDLVQAFNRGHFREDDLEILEARPVEWRCSCSRGKVESMLLGLGVAEIEAMIREEGEASIHCDFCNSHYHFSAVQLEGLIAQLVQHQEPGEA